MKNQPTWVYKLTENEPTHKLYTVGYYEPFGGEWMTDSDHSTKEDAGKRVALLNGEQNHVQLLTVLRQLKIAVKHIRNIQEKYKPEQPVAVGGYESTIEQIENSFQ